MQQFEIWQWLSLEEVLGEGDARPIISRLV
jgi:hypothetical protein